MTGFIMTLYFDAVNVNRRKCTQPAYPVTISTLCWVYIGLLGNLSTPEFKGQIITMLTDFSYVTISAKCRDRTWNFQTTRPVRYTLAFRI